ncbi:hypothetical protein [Tateyamaria sp.]|uniref:hypothetical protein n=1 Tax=Tateyamaria sp. TaxID=1929288 RepID=UPI0039B95294
MPERFWDVEQRTQICFALKTTDIAEAKMKAAQTSLKLDQDWQDALERGVSLSS